ncbi:MAG: N-acetylmuramoyl-L-alanine amidase [bacterium]
MTTGKIQTSCGRRSRQAVLVAALALLCLAAGAALAQDQERPLDPLAFTRVRTDAPEVTILVDDQAAGQQRAVTGRPLLQDSQEIYLNSATLAAVFRASRFWQGKLGFLDLKIGGRQFRFARSSRLVIAPEGETLLPVPILDYDGEVWIPVVAVTDVIGPQVQMRAGWNPAERRLSLGTLGYTIETITTEVLGRSTVVHLQCTKPLGYRAQSVGTGRIDLKIYGGEVDPAAVRAARARGLIQGVQSRQFADHVLIQLTVDALVGHFRTYTADSGREIVVVLEEEQVSSLPEPVPRGHASVNIPTGPLDVTNRIEVQTVVIDPGHGGHDVGAVSAGGILEKDVNLAVARELRSYLQRESNLQVVLTRERDEYLGLADRAELANAGGGDLFLSLHCNSWFNDGAQGLETYFLSPARSDWARSVEAAENQAGGLDVADDVEFIIWELVQNRFISSSSSLAEAIQADVAGNLGITDRGVRQAGFRVLVGAYMPAVLIELGFLSHPEEERRLGDRGYQRRLAEALGRAILDFRAEMAALQGAGKGGADGR